jgi:hypothetical protein
MVVNLLEEYLTIKDRMDLHKFLISLSELHKYQLLMDIFEYHREQKGDAWEKGTYT